MRVLFDTNVILDVLLDREPFADTAALLLSAVETGRVQGLMCATSATTIHYLAAKALGRAAADNLVRDLLELLLAAPVDHEVLQRASTIGFDDFEDAVVHEAAAVAECDAIVTRNLGDFQSATLPVLSPDELRAAIAALDG